MTYEPNRLGIALAALSQIFKEESKMTSQDTVATRLSGGGLELTARNNYQICLKNGLTINALIEDGELHHVHHSMQCSEKIGHFNRVVSVVDGRIEPTLVLLDEVIAITPLDH